MEATFHSELALFTICSHLSPSELASCSNLNQHFHQTILTFDRLWSLHFFTRWPITLNLLRKRNVSSESYQIKAPFFKQASTRFAQQAQTEMTARHQLELLCSPAPITASVWKDTFVALASSDGVQYYLERVVQTELDLVERKRRSKKPHQQLHNMSRLWVSENAAWSSALRTCELQVSNLLQHI